MAKQLNRKSLFEVYEEAIQKKTNEIEKFLQGFPEAEGAGQVNWRNNAAQSIIREAAVNFCCPECAGRNLEIIIGQLKGINPGADLNRKHTRQQILELAQREVDAAHPDIDWSKMGEQDCSNYRKEIMEKAFEIITEDESAST